MVITFGFAGGFTGGWFASKGDPFWTLSGGLAGVISVSAGADVYHPSLAYLLSFSGGMLAVWVGNYIEKKPAGRRRGRGGRRPRLLRLLRRLPRRHLRRRLSDRDQQHPGRRSAGSSWACMAFLPLAFLPGYVPELDPQEDEPAARSAGGRARGPRPGGVPAGLLPRVRARAGDHHRARRREVESAHDPARGVQSHDQRQGDRTKVGA